jgi:hypothetical protein
VKALATMAPLPPMAWLPVKENSFGVDRQGNPLPPGTMHMSRKGNDLVRGYLWNAARVAIRHNPAVRPLYERTGYAL